MTSANKRRGDTVTVRGASESDRERDIETYILIAHAHTYSAPRTGGEWLSVLSA